ncbi:MAG TPA: Rne/Rng family ribonuclease [Micromonosporaceae bacterium]
MLDNEPNGGDQTGVPPADDAQQQTTPTRRTRRKSAARAADAGTAPDTTAGSDGAVTTQPPAAQPPRPETEPVERPTTRRRRRAPAASSAEAATAQPPAEPAAPAPGGTGEHGTPVTGGTPADQGTPVTGAAGGASDGGAGTAQPPAKRTRRSRKKTAEPVAAAAEPGDAGTGAAEPSVPQQPAVPVEPPAPAPAAVAQPGGDGGEQQPQTGRVRRAAPPPVVLFMPPEQPEVPVRPAPAAAESEPEQAETSRSRRRRGRRGAEPTEAVAEDVAEEATAPAEPEADEEDDEAAGGRRRRRRGRRGRGRGKGGADDDHEYDEGEPAEAEEAAEEDEGGEADEADGGEPLTRRRRRRRRRGAAEAGETVEEDGVPTVVKVREPRPAKDEVQGVTGSTRLEAKRQRRRDGREQRRTRPPILSESEFLARRESVDRVMVIRQKGDRTQIAVLEDGILVEHYVTRSTAGTMVGNVYLGKVQNVLPSMEAAFIDIGRGRNAVLYAGEVNWDATGLEGRARSIESALKSGDSVLVQVTKDPVGHKGARLTSHLALSGRHLVYVPNGNASGISRKLPDNERKRLRDILKKLVPEGAGVIVRTAAEGATEDDLARDVKRLQAQWEDIQAKAAEGGAPALLYEEPDLVIRVVRDLFNEDFRELVVQGGQAYDMVEPYLGHVSPDLVSRVRKYVGTGDVFHDMRIDEQILKGLDRKVYLPSGGSLVIDRTEAMTVIDVNTGKYTGAGGNLEETVTRNNLEAAEEIVRQLRLRDLGGIIVIDFIDMVLESNRELVLRRLTECLGRDRTKHQVTEITSLGLVQMTRKRIGQGLLEAFSETCECCKGRGVIIHTEPVPEKKPARAPEKSESTETSGRRRGRRGGRAADGEHAEAESATVEAEPATVESAETQPGGTSLDEALGDEVLAGEGPVQDEAEGEGEAVAEDLDAEPLEQAEPATTGTGRRGGRRRAGR